MATIFAAVHTVTYIPVGKSAAKDEKIVNPGDLFDDMPGDAIANSIGFGAIRPATEAEIVRFRGISLDGQAPVRRGRPPKATVLPVETAVVPSSVDDI